MSAPAPGTRRYFCPLECGWYHDVPPPSLVSLAGISANPARDPHEAISSVVEQAMHREIQQTEQALGDHLSTHTTEQFVHLIQDLRAQITSRNGVPDQ